MKQVKRSLLAIMVMGALATVSGGVHKAYSAERIFNSWNPAGVANGPTVETTFTLTKPTTISLISNYHYNYGAGQDPKTAIGWIGIEQIVSGAANVKIGRWPVTANTTNPAAGALYTFWNASPNVLLGPGTYKIVDSDPATWSYSDYSYNDGHYSDGPNWEPGKGFSMVYAAVTPIASLPADEAVGVTTKQPLTITFSEKVAQGSAWNNITASYVNYATTPPTTVNVPLSKSLSGNVLKITPKAAYGAHALVTVKVPAGCVVDLGSPGGFVGSNDIIPVAAAPSGAYQFTFSTAP